MTSLFQIKFLSTKYVHISCFFSQPSGTSSKSLFVFSFTKVDEISSEEELMIWWSNDDRWFFFKWCPFMIIMMMVNWWCLNYAISLSLSRLFLRGCMNFLLLSTHSSILPDVSFFFFFFSIGHHGRLVYPLVPVQNGKSSISKSLWLQYAMQYSPWEYSMNAFMSCMNSINSMCFVLLYFQWFVVSLRS